MHSKSPAEKDVFSGTVMVWFASPLVWIFAGLEADVTNDALPFGRSKPFVTRSDFIGRHTFWKQVLPREERI